MSLRFCQLAPVEIGEGGGEERSLLDAKVSSTGLRQTAQGSSISSRLKSLSAELLAESGTGQCHSARWVAASSKPWWLWSLQGGMCCEPVRDWKMQLHFRFEPQGYQSRTPLCSYSFRCFRPVYQLSSQCCCSWQQKILSIAVSAQLRTWIWNFAISLLLWCFRWSGN